MDRVGKIIEFNKDVATVEVGLDQECVSGSCSDCHAAGDGKWIFTVPWKHACTLGQRVRVRERRGLFRLLAWIGFLVGFCVVLALGQSISAAARSEGSVEQRLMVVLGLLIGVAAWSCVRAWAKRQPQFRVEPLDAGLGVSRRPARKPFVPVDKVGRLD